MSHCQHRLLESVSRHFSESPKLNGPESTLSRGSHTKYRTLHLEPGDFQSELPYLLSPAHIKTGHFSPIVYPKELWPSMPRLWSFHALIPISRAPLCSEYVLGIPWNGLSYVPIKFYSPMPEFELHIIFMSWNSFLEAFLNHLKM